MIPFAAVLKANPYHDAKGRFASANSVSLSSLYAQNDDPTITAEKVLSKFNLSDRHEIAYRAAQAEAAPSSMVQHSSKGVFTDERKKLHAEIVAEYFTPERVKKATPAEGEEPTLVILGGRGGSGKSAFTNGKITEFDSDKFMLLDSDHIKERLQPPYKKWNAAEVHEEASYIHASIMAEAKLRGLNVVNDATLKSMRIESEILKFKEAGYKVEGHYMFVPRQISAVRAVTRYLSKGSDRRGRLVPPNVLLENTENERNFDELKKHFTHWSAWDNSGTEPKFLARKQKKKKHEQ